MRAGVAVAVAVAALAACHAPHPGFITGTPAAGVSIAVYDTFALVDDRRWIDVTGPTVTLDQVDPGSSLASLAVEPLGEARGLLHLGTCARDALPTGERAETARFTPAVRCTVSGPPGRYLVRLVYVSTELRYRAEHEIVATATGRATVTSRFAVTTPAWHVRGELAIYDGVPGGLRVPREVARGPAELDGSVAVLAGARREVPAELRRIFDGRAERPAALPEDDAGAAARGAGSTHAVWVWLELAHLHLAPGGLRVHVELPGEPPRDASVAADRTTQSDRPDAPLFVPLWVDPELRGMRQQLGASSAGASLAERFLFTVSNTGAVPREVWIEEHLRPELQHRIERAWPAPPLVDGDEARVRVTVPAGKLARAGFTVAYEN